MGQNRHLYKNNQHLLLIVYKVKQHSITYISIAIFKNRKVNASVVILTLQYLEQKKLIS